MSDEPKEPEERSLKFQVKHLSQRLTRIEEKFYEINSEVKFGGLATKNDIQMLYAHLGLDAFVAEGHIGNDDWSGFPQV